MRSNKIVILFIGDTLLLLVSFVLVAWFKESLNNFLFDYYSNPIYLFIAVWVFLSIISDKYKLRKASSLIELCVPIVRTNFIILAAILILIYGLKIRIASRLLVFGPIILSMLFELSFMFIYYFNKRLKHQFDYADELVGSIMEEEIEDDEEHEITSTENTENIFADEDSKCSIQHALQTKYLAKDQILFDFLSKHVPVGKIKRNHSLILKTTTTYNIEFVDRSSLTLFINLHTINSIKRINKFFIQVNAIVKNGGYFVGCVETLDLRKARIFSKIPPVLNGLYYTLDYIFKRLFPKLPFTKQLYFLITRGRNRVISEPETLGRLSSCGFDIVAVQYINQSMYFIVKKERKPILNNTPTYGPLVKLNRVGREGKIIKVFKMRTMYPYSEYIQDYIYKQNSLAEGGKISNDYRVTTLGRIMRKIWLDELPMFINVFKGEMKIVGVRPLSKHYFSLYPEEFQKRRIHYKPGLLPPFYADMPKTIEEIVASEKAYFDQYDQSPVKTDLKYFFKVIYNIFFNKARSN